MALAILFIWLSFTVDARDDGTRRPLRGCSLTHLDRYALNVREIDLVAGPSGSRPPSGSRTLTSATFPRSLGRARFGSRY